MVQCKNDNCKKRAYYGLKTEKPQFCREHKTGEMVDVKNKKCIKCNIKQPTFGLEGGKATHCRDCKSDIMIDVHHKKCIKCNIKNPSFGLEKGKATHCFDCKEDNMYNVNSKLCIKCNIIQPTFGLEEGNPTHCGNCKEINMYNVKDKLCICGTIPCFGLQDDKYPTCCYKCKTDKMIDIKNKTCFCGKARPSFGLEGDKSPTCCSLCRTQEMIDLAHKMCKSNYLEDNKSFKCIIQGNPKYKGFCTFCFANLFPNDPLTKQIQGKSKELIVRDYINENFEAFIHDKPLWTGNCDCTHRRRIDHRKLIGNTLLCIETDENQHKYYNDEEIRYDDLMMVHGGKFVYIRFNPDKYTEKGKTRNPQIKTRLSKLKEEIEKQIKRIEKEENEDLLEIIYMYYDC